MCSKAGGLPKYDLMTRRRGSEYTPKTMKSFIEFELFARCQECFIVGLDFLGECFDIVTAIINFSFLISFRRFLAAFFSFGGAVALLCDHLFGKYL